MLTRNPEYPKDTHSDVVGECRKSHQDGRPWTEVRALRTKTDGSDKHSCVGSQGKKECGKKATRVQHNSVTADPLYYCDTCGDEQMLLDENLYMDCKPTPDWYYDEHERRYNFNAEDKQEGQVEDTAA